MYPDFRFATVGGQSLAKLINDDAWNRDTFIPTVGKRGAAIIERAACPRPPRPPTPPSTTCVTGSWAATASG